MGRASVAGEPAVPAFVADILADKDKATDILSLTHPDYATRRESWQVLLDAFEGAGGFLPVAMTDARLSLRKELHAGQPGSSYLWRFPREDDSDYLSRQQMARYHNHLEALVDLYVRFIWTQGVTRSSNSDEYNAWIENVDGAGKSLDELLKQAASVGLVHGHAGVLVDKTQDDPKDQTKAGEQAEVIASVFTALSIPDWRFSRNTLTAVKLVEAAPQASIAQPAKVGEEAAQYLLWDEEGWARFDCEGNIVSAGLADLGMVPLVLIRLKPSYASETILGRPLVSNANIIRALFNRCSEEDNVLRDQAFSVLTVSVPVDGDVTQAKTDLGGVIGSAKALVVRGTIDYKTPDQTVPGTIRSNIEYLTQELYRAAHVRFERSTLAAESGESIRLQNTELNEMLQGFAKGLAAAELQIARAYFAWTTKTPEQAQKAFEAAQVVAQYPDEFFLDALVDELTAWMQGIQLELGPTMTRRIKKKAARRIDQDIPADELKKIDAEIDSGPTDVMPPAGPMDRGTPNQDAIAAAENAA